MTIVMLSTLSFPPSSRLILLTVFFYPFTSLFHKAGQWCVSLPSPVYLYRLSTCVQNLPFPPSRFFSSLFCIQAEEDPFSPFFLSFPIPCWYALFSRSFFLSIPSLIFAFCSACFPLFLFPPSAIASDAVPPIAPIFRIPPVT